LHCYEHLGRHVATCRAGGACRRNLIWRGLWCRILIEMLHWSMPMVRSILLSVPIAIQDRVLSLQVISFCRTPLLAVLPVTDQPSKHWHLQLEGRRQTYAEVRSRREVFRIRRFFLIASKTSPALSQANSSRRSGSEQPDLSGDAKSPPIPNKAFSPRQGRTS
jgi:hypothetical protein